ncbi:PH domain-containing protein [Peribacillus asahii]|uniref:PH domain-containing protein n=1 Tax=Peribacillus asahii TaxID=228899 RepID=UPI003830E2A8
MDGACHLGFDFCVYLDFLSIRFVQLDILGIIVMVAMIYLLGAIWFNTRYKIENDTLKISYGPIKKSIDIQEIKSIFFI